MKLFFLKLCLIVALIPNLVQASVTTEEGIPNTYDQEQLLKSRNEFIRSNGDLIIGEFYIANLKKTDKEVILNEVELYKGQPLSEMDPSMVISDILKKALFSDIKLSYVKNDNKVDVTISLNEKWSIILVPIASSNKNESSFGLMFVEMNLFGWNKQLYLGGTISSDNHSYMFGYSDPSILGTKFNSNIMATKKSKTYKLKKVDGEEYSRYKLRSDNYHLSFGHLFYKRLRFNVRLGLSDLRTDNSYDEILDPPTDNKTWVYGFGINYQDTHQEEFYQYGVIIALDSRFHEKLDDESQAFYTLGYHLAYSFRVLKNNRVSLNHSGSYGYDVPAINKFLIGGSVFKSLTPDENAADRYSRWGASYEWPFLALNFGAFTAQLFAEYGTFRIDNDPTLETYGFGAGFLFYLKKIAVPALGLSLTRNPKYNNYEFGFNIGIGL